MAPPDARMVRLAELEIDPSQLSAYRSLLAEEIAASIDNEPGVLMLHAVAHQAEPHQVRLLEVYASPAAYESHIQSAHFLKYKADTASMVRALRLIDVDPILLASRP